MLKGIINFSIIRSNVDQSNDYIGAFVPLIILLMDKKKYDHIDIETICKDFIEEYNLKIPRHPMQTILNRLKPDYICFRNGRFETNSTDIGKKAREYDFSLEIQKYNWLIENFIEFCHKFENPREITRDEAELLFIEFFKEHTLDLLFASENINMTLFPNGEEEITDPEKIFLINRYVNELMEKGGETSDYLISCAIGHNYASTILFRDFSNMKGKGICKNCYLDTSIIFDLLGINGKFRQSSIEEFLRKLIEKGTNLFIFNHNYENELLKIFEGCINWVESEYYDPQKASRSLQFFKNIGAKKIDVELFIAKIPDVLENNNIKRINAPDYGRESYPFQIQEESLRNIILENYDRTEAWIEETSREETIQKDIKSIASIYKLRKGKIPTRINDVEHVFISSNSSLAFASTRYEREIFQRDYFTIPTIVTDSFLGTIIWAQMPTTVIQDFNRSKLIAYSNSVIRPNPILLIRFKEEVDKAMNNEVNPIDKNTATLLLETNLSRALLSDMTLGDPNQITHETPYELHKKLQKKLVEEEKAKTDEALIKGEKLEIELIGEKEKSANQRKKLLSFIDGIAKIIYWFIVIFLIFITAYLLFIDIFSDQNSLILKILMFIVALIPGISGITVFSLGKKVRNFIKQKLINILIINE